MARRQRTREERLFQAAVLRRTLERRGAEGVDALYEGVLRDLELEDGEVRSWLEAHREEVDAAISRGRPPSRS